MSNPLEQFDAYAAYLGYTGRRRDLFAKDGWMAAAYDYAQGQPAVLLWTAPSERRRRLQRAIALLRSHPTLSQEEGRLFVLPLALQLDEHWIVFRVDGAVASAETHGAPAAHDHHHREGWVRAVAAFLQLLEQEGLELAHLSPRDVLLYPDGRAVVAFFDGIGHQRASGAHRNHHHARLRHSFSRALDARRESQAGAPKVSLKRGRHEQSQYEHEKALYEREKALAAAALAGAKRLATGAAYAGSGVAALAPQAKELARAGVFDYAVPMFSKAAAYGTKARQLASSGMSYGAPILGEAAVYGNKAKDWAVSGLSYGAKKAKGLARSGVSDYVLPAVRWARAEKKRHSHHSPVPLNYDL